METIEIYSVGICYMSVCASNNISLDKIEMIANDRYPTEISHHWSIANEPFISGDPNPCPCDKFPDTRKHYLLHC